MFGHEDALREMNALNRDGLMIVINDLLESGKLDIDDFARWIINFQTRQENTRRKHIYNMALRLGMICAKPSKENIQDAKKYMWENGFHNTSKYGNELIAEFGDNNLGRGLLPETPPAPAGCDHKFAFAKNESCWYRPNRYGRQYVSIDYFFCEKCLNEDEKKRSISLGEHEVPGKLPDWARAITNHLPDTF